MKKFAILMFTFLVVVYAYQKKVYSVEMRDGIKLHTNVFIPNANSKHPVIVIRTPYGADKMEINLGGVWFNYFCDTKGYVVVIQDTRGRFRSEGVDSVFLDDGWRDGKQDGFDTIEWINEQTWCNGNIGTWGGSAMGITQYLMSGAKPPHLKTCLVFVAPWSMYHDCVMQGGEYREYDVNGWLTGQNSMYMKDYYLSHSTYDTEWGYLNVSTRKDSVNVPMYHIGGWYDFFNPGNIKGFIDLMYNGGEGAKGNQYLLMGPWTHGSLLSNKAGELVYPDASINGLDSVTFKWFDYQLKGFGSIDDMPHVRYYLMGPVDTIGDWNKWVSADTFPPAYNVKKLYLGNGVLGSVSQEGQDTIVFDPENPVPTIGGNNLILAAGPYDWKDNISRADVIVYSTGKLNKDIEFVGDVMLHVYIKSNVLDSDITGFLIDKYPDGRYMLITDGILRLRFRNGYEREELMSPEEVYEVEVYLGTTAYKIPANHELILAVSSSNYPRFAVNPNSGEEMLNEKDTLIAENIILRGEHYPSFLSIHTPDALASVVERNESHIENTNLDNLKGKIFDITGREVSEAYTNGIYININGKKATKVIKIK